MDLSTLLSDTDSLLATMIKGGENIESPKVTVQPAKPAKEKPAKAAKAASKVATVEPTIEKSIDLGTVIGATAFTARLRECGLRPVMGDNGAIKLNDRGVPILVRQSREVRNDQIALLKECGIDPRDFGSALASAERRATMTLRPSVGEDRKARTAPTVAGFVAGVCDPSQRLLSDLRAKLRAMVDLKCKTTDASALVKIDAAIAGLHKQIDAML